MAAVRRLSLPAEEGSKADDERRISAHRGGSHADCSPTNRERPTVDCGPFSVEMMVVCGEKRTAHGVGQDRL